jgi:ferritin-like metal-binding protein YciE
VSEFDGVWDVRRTSGFLPPLVGVRKRIHGATGETMLGPVPVRFDVRGSELHYRAPLRGVVDVLEPVGGSYKGRAVMRGRTVGEFELTRVRVASDIEAQLIKQIDEAHALEQNVERMLDGLIAATDDPHVLDRLEHHKAETRRHAERMRARLAAHGASPSLARQLGGIVEALAKMPIDLIRGAKHGRTARDVFATEHLEIASYELLRRVAKRAGDEETARVADEILAEERSMAEFIASNWDLFTQASLRGDAGVRSPNRR